MPTTPLSMESGFQNRSKQYSLLASWVFVIKNTTSRLVHVLNGTLIALLLHGIMALARGSVALVRFTR